MGWTTNTPSGRLRLLGIFDQPLGGTGIGVQDHILDPPEQLRLDLVIDLEHPRIDDPHVKPGLDRMIKEYGVHRLPDGIVAPESERKIGYSSGSPASWKILLYPSDGLYEIDSVA